MTMTDYQYDYDDEYYNERRKKRPVHRSSPPAFQSTIRAYLYTYDQ
jgi:hypothetical protein